MATRRPRPIYRKEKPRSISKTGFMLCLLLAGGVMLVPAGGDLVQLGKAKARDWMLNAGLINFNDCVVTAERVLTCNSHAVGTPLPVALRQITDSAAQAAAEKQQRQAAESRLHELALEIDQLNARLKQAQLAGANNYFPVISDEVRPTGLFVTNPATGGMMDTSEQPRPDQAGVPVTITPPNEGD